MNIEMLQQRVARGLTVASSCVGNLVAQYRPLSANDPVAGTPLAMMQCAFDSQASLTLKTPLSWQHPEAYALMNSCNLRVGDYLVTQPNADLPALDLGTYFVARWEPARPPLVILTNNVLSFWESDTSTDDNVIGLRPPEGPSWATGRLVAQGWPVSQLGGSAGRMPAAHLGSDVPAGTYSVLMPAIPDFSIHQGLQARDAAGNTYQVGATQISAFGIHLNLLADQS